MIFDSSSSPSTDPEIRDEYDSFRSSVPLKRVDINDICERTWLYFEIGPKEVRCPLIFLPPVSGGADVYFKQIVALSAAGYRVISVEYPSYWNIDAFCDGFRRFLDALNIVKAHIFGASLGGFLAQKFAETYYAKTASLILCNSFSNTAIFHREEAALIYWAMPGVILKRMLLSGFPSGPLEKNILKSVDFMVCRLESMEREKLASRMTLNCARCLCDPRKLDGVPVTIINALDSSALSESARSDILKQYPKARRAELKTGGNYPYLSRSAEIDLHIKLHLLPFDPTALSAR